MQYAAASLSMRQRQFVLLALLWIRLVDCRTKAGVPLWGVTGGSQEGKPLPTTTPTTTNPPKNLKKLKKVKKHRKENNLSSTTNFIVVVVIIIIRPKFKANTSDLYKLPT